MAEVSLTAITLTALLASFLTGILPALFWLWFWLQEDRKKPEPKWRLGIAFAAGGLMVLPAYLIQQFLRTYVPFSLETGLYLVIILWAAVEEGLKYLAAHLTALRTWVFDEAVDAMVYMITVALGFAAVENSLFVLSAWFGSDLPLGFLLTGNFRFLGATLVHVVASAVMGFFIAQAFCARRPAKTVYLAAGWITATVLHALFNYFIIIGGQSDVLRVFIVLWVATILVILFFEQAKQIVCLWPPKKDRS